MSRFTSIMATHPLVYLNTAACGLVPEEVTATGYRLYQQLQANASTAAENWRDHQADKIKATVAAFLDAPASQLAWIPNFSFGINSLVQSLSGRENILLFRRDYPSLIIPFQLNNYNITWADTTDEFNIDMNRLEQLLTQHDIDLLAISHVQWLSGFKINLNHLSDICRRLDVRLIVDVTQSLGAEPIRVSQLDADAVIASNYKWMNAGFGTGVMYVSDRFLQQYPPVVGGANSYPDPETRTPSVRCFEPGHTNMFGYNLLEAAITEKNKLGLEKIAAHNRQLAELFLAGLADPEDQIIGPTCWTANRSAILFLKDTHNLSQRLKAHNIIASVRNGNIRISFHYYNTAADVARLLEVIGAA